MKINKLTFGDLNECHEIGPNQEVRYYFFEYSIHHGVFGESWCS